MQPPLPPRRGRGSPLFWALSLSAVMVPVLSALGPAAPAPPPKVARDVRLDAFRAAARAALDRPAALPDETAVLGKCVRLVHASTLGCALAQKGPGLVRFDALVAEPPNLGPPAAGRDGGKEDVEQLVRTLLPNRPVAQRTEALKALASSGAVNDLTPSQADQVADYVLSPAKAPSEWQNLFESGTAVLRARPVLLALAGSLGNPATKVRQETLARVVAAAAGRDVPPGLSVAEARAVLLRQALEQLESADFANRAARLLRQLWADQAALLGYPRQDAAGGGPVGVLAGLIGDTAGKLGKQKLSQTDAASLKRVPRELAAAEALAENDMQQTVWLQRLWVEVLATWVADQRPDRAGEARGLCGDLRARQPRLGHVLEQLQLGAEMELRLWLLLNEP